VDDRQSGSQRMSDIKARETINRRLWFYSLVVFLPAILVVPIILSNFHGLFANAQKAQLSSEAPSAATCVSRLARSLSLRCVSFSGHLYAIADIDLRLQKIVFTISDNGQERNISGGGQQSVACGKKPLLVTNAGIYGTDNRPLGLLI